MNQSASSPAIIRQMTRQDIAAGLQLCRMSGWNQLESDWSLFLQLSPTGCRVAEKSGHVVGTVATVRYEDRFSWLAMMLVDPKERRTGIGTQLLCGGLTVLSDQGCVRLDATAAGRILYEGHGFKEEYQLSRMTAPRGPARISSPSEIVRCMEERDLPAVFERDREVFGADRSDLLRALLGRAPELAWIADGERVKGYCLGRPGFLYQSIGPIVADNEQVAADLLSQCLLAKEGPFVIDAPHHSAAWLHWLSSIGFVQERAFVRMYRGENRHTGIPECLFGIVGPEFG